MKKSFIIAAFVAFTFTACNNSGKSSTDNSNPEQEQTSPVVNKDSIDKAHGHSHDQGDNQTPVVNQDSTNKSLIEPNVNQDSLDKNHGHKH